MVLPFISKLSRRSTRTASPVDAMLRTARSKLVAHAAWLASSSAMACRPWTGSLAIIWNTASSAKKSPSFFGSFHALRKSRTACSFSLAPMRLCLAAGTGLCFVQLFGRHEYGPGLRSFGRADDAPTFQEVHQAAGSGEADSELALEHRGRAQLGTHDELHSLLDQVVIVVVVDAAVVGATSVVVALDPFDVLGLGLAPPVGHDLPHLVLADPRSLDAPRHV